MKIKTLIDNSINWGNAIPATPWQLAAIFAVTVILRNLMEAISLGVLFSAPAFVLHFPVAYIFPMLLLVFIMQIFSGYDTAKLLKIMIFAWTLTLLPPIIDKIAGTTSAIGYYPLDKSNASWFLINFFNPAVKIISGTTTGIRIEATIGCLLAGVFSWAVAPKKRLLRGISNTIVFAPVFLAFFTWPYLITVIFQSLFPGDGVANSLLQWHAATEAPITGASHFMVYLIDMLPVSFLALWYVKKLSSKNWLIIKSNIHELLPLAYSAILGTIAAITIMPSNGTTLADAVTVSGALLAALWLVTSSEWKSSFRGVASAFALSIAWAAGWETLVFAGLALAISALPVPKKIRNSLFGIALFITTLSPVGFSLLSVSAIIAMLAIISIIHFAPKKPIFSLILFIPIAILFINPPASEEGAWIRGVLRQTDTFARSSRVGLAMESASRLTAAGGSWLTLGETTHLTGQSERSRFVCEMAMARGDSSVSLMKVLLNLAFERVDTTAFNQTYQLYTEVADDSELNTVVSMRVAFLSMNGDTTALNLLHSRAGLNPMLLRAMASAQMTMGDTLRSLQYSMAFLRSPYASADDWAKTISIAAVTRAANWDSLYTESEDYFGYCLPIMLARLRASVIATGEADREDLLERCILIKPDSKEVLQTAAIWFNARNNPEETLLYASRAIASDRNPTRTSFSLALNSALELQKYDEAAIIARYGAHHYPGIPGHRAVLAGILKAKGDTVEVHLLEQSFSDIEWAQLLCDSLANEICSIQN